MPRTRSNSFTLEAPEFLFSVTCIKKYTPSNVQELEMSENDLLHVIEDKDLFYLALSTKSKKKGFIPKNYTAVQKPLTVLSATVKESYAELPTEMKCESGDRIILLAKLDNGFCYCKKMSRDLVLGVIRTDLLFVEGDTSKLPSFPEYQQRTTPIAEIAEPLAERSTTLSKPVSENDEKVLDKIRSTSRPRSQSFKSIQQFISPPKY